MVRSQVLRVLATLAIMLACWIAARALHLAPPRPRPAWNGISIVRQASGEDALLTRALIDAIDEGVSPIFGADVVGAFMRHVHGELAERKVARLCLRMIVEGVAAAHGALWAPSDAVRLLVALQREMDTDGGAAFSHLQRVLALVRAGWSAGEVLTTDGRLCVPGSRSL